MFVFQLQDQGQRGLARSSAIPSLPLRLSAPVLPDSVSVSLLLFLWLFVSPSPFCPSPSPSVSHFISFEVCLFLSPSSTSLSPPLFPLTAS